MHNGQLQQYGIQGDPVVIFNQIDRDGAGMVLFEEFCDYAVRHSLDLPDDDDLADQE
jgi:hypothetical protein